MYKLNPLPYSFEELEPFIDTHTLALHYKKHQQNYLNKLNELLIANNYNYEYSLPELAKRINDMPFNNKEDILFNLGGVINHNIYFNSMTPNKVMPSETLLNKIQTQFGNYDNFISEFKKSAMALKGSGYTYLVLDQNNDLKIINLKNQDNPYTNNLIPLLALDVWEHAYYINYENKRDLYIDNFFNIVNFTMANKLFDNI